MKTKLEKEHITSYLPYNLKVMVDDVVCEVEGIDLYMEDTLIAERVNYKFEDVKLLLYPLSDYEKFEMVLDEMSEYDIVMIDENPDLVLRLPYDVIDKMLYFNIDIFGLINKGLAINLNNL